MKFSCEKYLIQAAVATASRAAAGKNPIPALEGLLIEAGHDVRITGYDLKKGIYTNFPADVSEPGSIVLGAKLFGEIIRSLPDGIVKISTKQGNVTKITCGNAEFSIIGTDAEDYPELPELDYQSAISLPQKALRGMIEQTIFAVSDNESRPVYTGSLLEVENDELTIVSVDGYRLALRREAIDRSDVEKTSFIVPGGALSDVEKICSDSEDPVKIIVGSKHVSFTVDDTVLISRRLDGEFLNYRKSIPSEFKVNVKAERAALGKVVDRVSLIIDDKVKNPLRCTFGDDEIRILCVTSLGRAEDVCPVEGQGGDLEIGFNNRYLQDVLRIAPADKLLLRLNSGTSPCVVMPEDESDSFLYMILPVRLRVGD
ncbi:MAG: DNA polymerase III subunit beta [Oscillospiraceae bacterium]|jgi:DNA polymerase-3 subunit beta